VAPKETAELDGRETRVYLPIEIHEVEMPADSHILKGQLLCQESRFERWWRKWKVALFAVVGLFGVSGLVLIGSEIVAIRAAPAIADSCANVATHVAAIATDSIRVLRSSLDRHQELQSEQMKGVQDGIGELKDGQKILLDAVLRNNRSRPPNP
jgi:hypothetical protein